MLFHIIYQPREFIQQQNYLSIWIIGYDASRKLNYKKININKNREQQ